MPPLWLLRYIYFIESVKDFKLQAKQANINLNSYVNECWKLKEQRQLITMEFQQELDNQTISIIELNTDKNQCYENKKMNKKNWCMDGICLMKQMPDEMLEQIVVLSAICFRW